MPTPCIRRAAAGAAAVLLVALAACGPPVPRDTAQQGVPWTGDRRAQDARYYQGADPDFPRGVRGSRGGP
jgi:hypothetical protein